MYLSSSFIMYGNEVISYYGANSVVVMAVLKYMDLHSDTPYHSQYNSLTNDEEYGMPNNAIRDTLDRSDDDDHLNRIVSMMPAPSNSNINLNDNFEPIENNIDVNFQSNQKFKELIKRQTFYFDFFCRFIQEQCQKLTKITGKPKTINFQYMDEHSGSFIDIDVPLYEFIVFLKKYEELIEQTTFNINFSNNEFIDKFKLICSEFIDNTLVISLTPQSSSDNSPSQSLKEISKIEKMSEILLNLHSEMYRFNTDLQSKIYNDIKYLFNEFKNKLISELFQFFLDTEGMQELQKDLKTKTHSTHLILTEMHADSAF